MVCLFTAYTTLDMLGKPPIYYYIHIQNKWRSRLRNVKFMTNSTLFFYKNTKLIFAQNLRTNQKQSSLSKRTVSYFQLKYSEQNSSKCHKISKRYFASHAYSRTTASSQMCNNKQKVNSLFNKLT